MGKTIYDKRREMNQWEIMGVEKFLVDNMNPDSYSYSDGAIHSDYKNGHLRIAVFLIENKSDLYFKTFEDEKPNKTYRFIYADDSFQELDDDFNHIRYVEYLNWC